MKDKVISKEEVIFRIQKLAVQAQHSIMRNYSAKEVSEVMDYINQEATLDSELNPFAKVVEINYLLLDRMYADLCITVEEANYNGHKFLTVSELMNEYPKTRDKIIQHIQAQQQALSDKEYTINWQEELYQTVVKALKKSQSKLNAIEEAVGKELNDYDSLDGSEMATLIKIKQIIGGNNES